ncbi:MAG: ribosome maturation factor RimM [Weeksellaceae bacterium]|nr:ribosome maturation factor RimM [Weeksellaceae bacterium]
MQKKDCYYLGTITKLHGYQGELNVHMDTDDPQHYQNLPAILIERNGLMVPFFLKKAQVHRNHHLRIIIEDFDNPQQLIGREVFLPLDSLPALTGTNFYNHEVKGFQVFDQHCTLLGSIDDVRDTGTQILLEVQHASGAQILIPAIDPWISKIDRDTKEFHVELPEGFLDVFLSNDEEE